MRGREFGMKDAYSFDRDEAGAEESYRSMFAAYTRIFERCGLRFKAVEADSGQIGGSFSHEFMVLADTGEDAVVSCTACGYAANLEKAAGRAAGGARCGRRGADADARRHPGDAHRRGGHRVPRRRTPTRLVKTLLFDAGGEIVAVLVRGDHQVNETKLKNHLGGREAVPATPAQVEKATGAPVGFAGPVGLAGVPVFADRHVEAMAHFVVGANAADAHLRRRLPRARLRRRGLRRPQERRARRSLPEVRHGRWRSCAASRSGTSSSSARSTRGRCRRPTSTSRGRSRRS